jgi:hypothetical protein
MFLYIIKCQDFHKIGVANDVESRLAQLSTGNPYPLEVQTIYEFENAEPVERAIHQRYKSVRQRGEWFTLGYDDLKNIHNICLSLGGSAYEYSGKQATDDSIEEAEEAGEYSPTIEDVKRIMNDPNYRLEYRYGNIGLRGFAWRLRSGNKECPLYIGKSSPIFEQVRKILPDHLQEMK